MSIELPAVEAAVAALSPEALLAGASGGQAEGVAPAPARGSVRLAHAFALSDRVVLALADVRSAASADPARRFPVPLVLVGGGRLRPAAMGEGAWRELALAIAGGRTIPALAPPSPPLAAGSPAPAPAPIRAALVCRPSPGLGEVVDPAGERPGRSGPAWQGWPETAPSAADPAAVAVLGDRLALQAYSPLETGLEPDLELTAFLAEEARFPGVPRVAGFAEVVARDGGAATVAMLRSHVPDAVDARRLLLDRLSGLLAAPGTVSLEWATEVAEDLGILLAELHAALASPPPDAPDLAPREATRDELRSWRGETLELLDEAPSVVAGRDPVAAAQLRAQAPAIAERASVFEALATAPLVTRVHGALGLERILVAPDGYRVVGFGGPPGAPLEERRRPHSPLWDLACLLRSLDAVVRAAEAAAGAGGPDGTDGRAVDPRAWRSRARQRLLDAYGHGLLRAGGAVSPDPDLLTAFELLRALQEVAAAGRRADPDLAAAVQGLVSVLEPAR